LRRHAELGLHAVDVQPLVAHGVDQRDLRRHQLRQVLVAGGDQHLVALGRGHAGQRADGVVGFDAGHLQHRPAQQAHDFVDGLDLLRSGSGMGARWALYRSYQASRKVGPLASKTQAACAAGNCSRSLFIIATMPCSAPVGKPSGERRSGIAW
jgi:hypothetical protein